MFPYYPWDDLPYWARNGGPQREQSEYFCFSGADQANYQLALGQQCAAFLSEEQKARQLLARNGEDCW